MVGKLSVSAFQNFFRIENPLSIKEVMSQNVWYVLFPSSTSSTYIALQPLCVFDLSSTSLTYIEFDGMVGKLSVSAFQNFFRIENPLSIKEVMSQNVCVCSFPIFDVFDIHSITALMCI